ncbi:hypothetical protein [Comamonas sp. GB3 AK4-5]|uniref:hypothetical protein n=1 Tax=Comamonas sp. GB3 AK4-5 TaxID=3231487 RepID=UPI00351DB5AD
MQRNAFHLPVSTFARELQRNRDSKPKRKSPASQFHITGGNQGRQDMVRLTALKKTSI